MTQSIKISHPVITYAKILKFRFHVSPLLCLALWASLTSTAVADIFPSPIGITMIGTSTAEMFIPSSTATKGFILLGSDFGEIQLSAYISGFNSFSPLAAIQVGGQVSSLQPWESYVGDGVGVLASTINEDQLIFIVVSENLPRLTIVDTITLDEDPGSVVFVGRRGAAPVELAVSLPGIDQITIFEQYDDVWSQGQTLNTGDRPEMLAGVDLNGDLYLDLVSADRGPLSENLGLYIGGLSQAWSRVGQYDLPGIPSDMVQKKNALEMESQILVSYSDTSLVDVLQGESGTLSLTHRIDFGLPVDGMLLVETESSESDLLTWNTDHGLVGLHPNNGSTWDLGALYYPGCLPVTGIFGSINNDELVDLVFLANQDGNAMVMFGLEGSRFAGLEAAIVDFAPVSSVRADFDRDGNTDLVVASNSPASLTLLFGDNDGISNDGSHQQMLEFIPGDMLVLTDTADPAPRLAIYQTSTQTIKFLEYDSEMGFEETGVLADIPPFRHFTSVDCDNDGYADLVLAHLNDEAAVYYGDADGNFQQNTHRSFPRPFQEVAIVDLNDDNLGDIVGIDGISRIWTSLAQSDRSYMEPTWTNTGLEPMTMCIGDMDGDLDDDVVVGTWESGSLSLLENEQAGRLNLRVSNIELEGRPSELGMGDVSGDGLVDLIFSYGSTGEIGLIRGTELWEFYINITMDGAVSPRDLTLEDVNNDQALDLVIVDYTLGLGLTAINAEGNLLPVEPSDLSWECANGILEIQIHPDENLPWRLDVGRSGQWQNLAADGRAASGQLVQSGDIWTLNLSVLDLPAGTNNVLKLTLANGGPDNVLVISLDQMCEAPTNPVVPAVLTMSKDPWPNPFNPQVYTSFDLARSAQVRASVYNLAGRRVAVLADRVFSKGTHILSWDGKTGDGLAGAGVYLLRVESADIFLTKKVLMLK